MKNQSELGLRTHADLSLDLSQPPFVPKGFELDHHNNGGGIIFDVSRFWQISPAEAGISLEHNSSVGQLVVDLHYTYDFANAVLLDFLLVHDNQDLIPEELRPLHLLFAGTMYKGGWLRSAYYDHIFDRWDWEAVNISKVLESKHRLSIYSTH